MPYDDSVQTKFRNLLGTFHIRNGMLYNDDLFLISEQLRVNGGGQVSHQEMFFYLETVILDAGSNKNLETIKGFIIPLQIIGQFNSPVLYMDSAKLLKQFPGAAKPLIDFLGHFKLGDLLK